MNAALKRSLPYGLVALISALLVSSVDATGDWTVDSWPAVHALAHGRVADYISAEAMMGPFATMLQAPFAALSGGGVLVEYRWAAFPCLLAAGILGLYLAGLARRRGASRLGQVLLALLCLVNPLTLEALESGHPEEVLTAALAVGAIATASEGRTRTTAVLLGLALASKQWAVIAILPALMALPAQQFRVGAASAAIVVALMLPAVVAAPGSFLEVHGNAANTGRIVTPWSVWYPLAEVTTEEYRVGPTRVSAQVHEAPDLVGTLSHPLIVLLAFGLPLVLALRRGRVQLAGSEAMALLALLALLRCALDPVDNVYYHLPLLLALLGWDALAPRGLPVRGLAAAAAALVFWDWAHHLSDPASYNRAYLLAVSAAGFALVAALFRPGWLAPGRRLTAASRRLFDGFASNNADPQPRP